MRHYARPVPLNLAKCRIRETLLNIINFVKTSGSPDSITETIDMPQETDPVLNIDIKQFTQVFMNVVINAYQALSGVAGAEIKIRTFIESKKMMIEVIDNGPGVAAEIAHKIFEPFFTTKHKGSGLGLAVSQKIVRSMNGDITVSSVPGKETKFTIMLPVCEDAG